MASPNFHRRQAEILTELAKTIRNRDTRDELLRLAADHWQWARQGDQPTQQEFKAKIKNTGGRLRSPDRWRRNT
ncbi:MAG: hypothetical protein C5B58_05625 [Acidobacteria bacterium]|nr:MAG: hypothetical protein C5B58_05625 [Acidobacteriota bacterium]